MHQLWQVASHYIVAVTLMAPSLSWQANLVLGGQSALGTLGLTAELLQCTVVLADVDLVLLLHQLHEVVHHTVVKVLTTKMCISARADHLWRPPNFPSLFMQLAPVEHLLPGL